jgi:hypothetical protein
MKEILFDETLSLKERNTQLFLKLNELGMKHDLDGMHQIIDLLIKEPVHISLLMSGLIMTQDYYNIDRSKVNMLSEKYTNYYY